MITIAINASNTRFYMSTVPAMPQISLSAMIQGIPIQAKPVFTWTFKLEYTDFISVPGALRRQVRTKTHPAMQGKAGNPVIVPFATPMCGRLTATVVANINGTKVSATRNDILIGGGNPSTGELWGLVHDSIVRKMINQESGGKQFSDTAGRSWIGSAINPNWSGDNARGVGLGQLTNPAPDDGDIWNWRTNAAHLQQRFVAKRAPAATLHTRIAASSRFLVEAKALAAWRAGEGLAAVPASLAALTSNQQDLEGLRAYNGYGIPVDDQYLSYVHEFEPATIVAVSAKRKGANGQPLRSPRILDVDAAGHAQWVQIGGAERKLRYGGKNYGDPNYVANVLSQQG